MLRSIRRSPENRFLFGLESVMKSTGLLVSQARPGFFRAACREARRGGNYSYRVAAQMLCRALHQLGPTNCGESDWSDSLDQLRGLVVSAHDTELRRTTKTAHDHATWRWFTSQLPRCAAMVPATRRASFLKGVFDAFEAGQVELGA